MNELTHELGIIALQSAKDLGEKNRQFNKS